MSSVFIIYTPVRTRDPKGEQSEKPNNQTQAPCKTDGEGPLLHWVRA
ncbi:hypothetical protein BRCON_1189 [Candidatus Sumerlaea chitinivorans]|uniref:Uncharacterized protein n=1 Tax=Sumerlaea chitinivorans TaxID=2250252 RepID=A0A2Z4Y4S3_SUMC1|nr:hypothetical protein BRCON_1189 [Candidatus Sumerlaea chitinivorans]